MRLTDKAHRHRDSEYRTVNTRSHSFPSQLSSGEQTLSCPRLLPPQRNLRKGQDSREVEVNRAVSRFRHQLFFLALELLAHLFQLLLVEFAARTGKPCAFLFVDMVVDQLAQDGQLRGPLLARLVASLRHLLQLLFDDLVLIDPFEREKARMFALEGVNEH